MPKKKTALETWLNVPSNLCLFSPAGKKKSFNDQSKVARLARADWLKTNPYKDMEKIFTHAGIIYYKDDEEEFEVIAVNARNFSKVGWLETTLMGEQLWLDYIEVKPKYRGKGIGTQLVRAAVMSEPDLQVPSTSGLKYDAEGTLFLTTEGAGLINHCTNLGILNYEKNRGTADNYVPEAEQDIQSSPSQSY